MERSHIGSLYYFSPTDCWDGKKFTLADARFPDQYRAFVRVLEHAESVAARYGSNREIENNLAYFYSVTGQTKKAAALRRALEREIRKEIAAAGTNAERENLRQSLYEVRHCPAVCAYDWD